MLIKIKFPKNYTPLPKGYEVVWSEERECYFGMNEEIGDGSPNFDSRFRAREWCFLYAMFQIEDLQIFSNNS